MISKKSVLYCRLLIPFVKNILLILALYFRGRTFVLRTVQEVGLKISCTKQFRRMFERVTKDWQPFWYDSFELFISVPCRQLAMNERHAAFEED